MKNKILIRILSIFFAAVFLLAIVPTSASAASVETTPVLDDLKKMEDFVLEDYVKNVYDDTLSIITLDEYGYDYRGYANDYGLYIYIFNPSGVPIKMTDENKIELGISTTTNGEPIYRTYSLLPCSYSTNSGYEHLFYKFKIDVGSGFYAMLNSKRVYYVGDISVVRNKAGSPVKRQAADCKFTYTGYSAYHGADSDSDKSDLRCDVEMIETVELELHGASWKTISSDKGANFQYEVSSVYFAVPNHWLEKYGSDTDLYKGLYGLYCKWYETQTNCLITNNDQLYSDAKKIEDLSIPASEYQFFPSKNYPFYFNLDNCEGRHSCCFNLYDCNHNGGPKLRDHISKICNVYKFEDKSFESLSNEETLSALVNADGTVDEYIDIGNINRHIGWNEKEFTVEDGKLNDQIKSYASMHNDFISMLVDLDHLHADSTGYADLNVFHRVTSNDFEYDSTKEAADALFLSEADYSDFKSFYNSKDKNLYTVYILRFAVTDYVKAKIPYVNRTDAIITDQDYYGTENYYMEKTVFLDFDVLEMSFRDVYGNIKTLPVKADPINIVGTITKPPAENDEPGLSDFDLAASLAKLLTNAKKDMATTISILVTLLFSAILIVVLVYVIIKIFRALFRSAERSSEISERRSRAKFNKWTVKQKMLPPEPPKSPGEDGYYLEVHEDYKDTKYYVKNGGEKQIVYKHDYKNKKKKDREENKKAKEKASKHAAEEEKWNSFFEDSLRNSYNKDQK